MAEIDWDQVPDDELEETVLERVIALKEMVPEGVRNGASSAFDWGWWMTKGSFGLARQTLWTVTTTALILVIPFAITKELLDAEKSQVAKQQQILLGRPT